MATVFVVPKDAIVYGIALSPDRSTLAVAYTPDFHLDGGGLWTLDVTTRALTKIAPVVPKVYLTNLAWSPDEQSVLVTSVDRTGAVEQLAVARVDLTTGTTETLVTNAVSPAVDGIDLYCLTVDAAHARRAIGHVDSAGTRTAIPVCHGRHDLDHLLRGASVGELRVAVLTASNPAGVTVGTPASAHGNHAVPSTWWSVASSPQPSACATALDPTIVYDAATTGESIVYATQQGLTIATGSQRIDLVASRTIRFVAA